MQGLLSVIISVDLGPCRRAPAEPHAAEPAGHHRETRRGLPDVVHGHIHSYGATLHTYVSVQFNAGSICTGLLIYEIRMLSHLSGLFVCHGLSLQ